MEGGDEDYAYEGTDRLGRPLTDAEKARLGKLLRRHRYPEAWIIGLAFARRLGRRRGRADGLIGRAALRLVRQGWDPRQVSLVSILCRMVWSEWTHSLRADIAARAAEEVFLREREVAGEHVAAAPEAQAIALEEAHAARAHAVTQLDALKLRFESSGDDVNLLWLGYRREGIDDAAEMARRSGRDVTEFYRAADRRKRHVKQMLIARSELSSREPS